MISILIIAVVALYCAKFQRYLEKILPQKWGRTVSLWGGVALLVALIKLLEYFEVI